MSVCAVFVCDKAYFAKFTKTLSMLRNAGDYRGDIILIIGDDLKDKTDEIKDKFNISVKYFPNWQFSESFMQDFNNLKRPGLWKNKKFQYHKFNVFDTYFKQWEYVFYIDCGITICRPVQPIIDSKIQGKILASPDPWGPFVNKWSLGTQFDNTHPGYEQLNDTYDLLGTKNYFNTSVMLFDTALIEENLTRELYSLATKHPFSITNDQAIIALYFIHINNSWIELPKNDEIQNFYEYKTTRKGKPHIMYKML